MKPITRATAIFLTLCLFFCFSAAAFAEDDPAPSAEETLPVSKAVPQSSGTPIVHSGNPIVTVGTLKFSYWSYLSGASKTASLQAIDLKTVDGAVAYCIEPELSGDGTNYTLAQQEAAWAKLPANLRYAIALVLTYGYPNQDYAASSDDIYWYGKVSMRNTENYIATQLIIWELLAGVRSSTKPFALTGETSFRNSFDIGWATIRSTYDAITAKMATHNAIPAYASGIEGSYVYTLEYDSAADAYVYQLPTQRQSDWRECRMTLPDGIHYLKAADGMTVIGFSATAEAAAALPADGYVVSGQSPYLSVAPDTAVLCWMCGGSQTVATMPVGPDPARAFFTLKANVTADLELIKTSPDGKISGIAFTVYDSGGTKIASGITNENGRMTVRGLQIGQTYTVTESVPEGYVCTENNKKITIQAGSNTVSFENKPLPSLKIIKESPDGNVAGISFQIFKGDEAHTAGTVWKTVTTGSDGTILLEKIERGYYWIREIVPEGYAPQEDQRIWVGSSNTADNPATVTFANKPLILKIVKTSNDGNIAGISFQIFKGDEAHTAGTVWKTVTTDRNGTILLEKIERGYYWIREIVPDGYAPQEDQRIWVNSSNTADNPATVTFANKPLVLKIIKTSSDRNVAGISFQIFKGDEAHTAGTVWKTVTTDSNGTILLEKIERGYYWIREVVPDGYATQEDQRIEVTSANTADSPATVTFRNQRLCALKLIKESPDGNVSGITFKIYTSEYASKLDNVWRTAVTDEAGVILMDDLPAGTYWIKEVVPEGYQVQAVQKVTVTEENTGENTAVVTFANIPNPCLKLIKTSEDGNVAGITFQIFTGRSAPTQDAVPLYTVTTGDDGTVLVKNLSVGIYWVREIVPEGYAPQEVRKIRVLSSNTTDNPATVRFDNTLLRGSIAVNKVDFGAEPLPGATFLLEYSVNNGATWQAVRPASADDSGIGTCGGVDADGTITTGTDGKAVFSELIVYGVTYRLTETAAPNGYLLLAEPVFTGILSANAEQNYELTFDVVNAPSLQMPPTGGAGNLQMVVSLATTILLSAILAFTLYIKRRKNCQ